MPIFLAPWFLLAAAAVAVPLALHLLWRRNPAPVPFSTLRFLKAADVRTRRSRRLTRILLLTARVLIVLLLAFAFARPKLPLSRGLFSGNRTVLLVLDASASMRYLQGGKSSFQLAQARAERVLDGLGETDKVAILAPGAAEAQPVFPPTSELAKARARLRELAPGFRRVDLLADLAERLAHLPAGMDRAGLEIHIFSDFQETAWPAEGRRALAEAAAASGMTLFLNQVRPETVADAGIVRASPRPPVLPGAGSADVETEARFSPDFGRPVAATLWLDGKKQEAQSLTTASPVGTLHGMAEAGTGPLAGRVELDEDAFAPDNVRHFCIQRRSGMQVWLVGSAAETFFLRAATLPGGDGRSGLVPRLRTWTEFLAAADAEPGGVFFLCNPPAWDSATLQKIDACLNNGATFVLFPGDGAFADGLPAGTAIFRGLACELRTDTAGKPVRLMASSRPPDLEKRVLDVLGVVPAFSVHKRLAFKALPPDSWHVLEWPDGTPFLAGMERGRGRLWIASASADRDWADWPVTPLFVVLHQELLRSAPAGVRAVPAVEVGEEAEMPWLEDVREAEFSLERMDGAGAGAAETKRTLKRRTSDEPFRLPPFAEPGVYRLRRGGEERGIAVNVPAAECTLAYRDAKAEARALAPAAALAATTPAEQEEALALARSGRPAWPFLLGAAFLLALAETALGGNALRRRGKGAA